MQDQEHKSMDASPSAACAVGCYLDTMYVRWKHAQQASRQQTKPHHHAHSTHAWSTWLPSDSVGDHTMARFAGAGMCGVHTKCTSVKDAEDVQLPKTKQRCAANCCITLGILHKGKKKVPAVPGICASKAPEFRATKLLFCMTQSHNHIIARH